LPPFIYARHTQHRSQGGLRGLCKAHLRQQYGVNQLHRLSR
jgi:hypothetical protein